MCRTELLDKLEKALHDIVTSAEIDSGILESLKASVVDHFGQTGLALACLVAGLLTLVLFYHLLGLILSLLKRLVLPALGLAFLAGTFSPLSFMSALPPAIALCTIVYLVRD